MDLSVNFCRYFGQHDIILQLKPAQYLSYDYWSQIEPEQWPLFGPIVKASQDATIIFHIAKLDDSLESAWSSSILQTILIIKKRLHSLEVQDTSFSTLATLGLLPIVAFHEKKLLG